MRPQDLDTLLPHRLIFLGIALFLLGLITGLFVPVLQSPRIGLSAHLQGILNGLFLVAIGLLWERLQLSGRSKIILYWGTVYGTFANFVGTFLAALWGATGFMQVAVGGVAGKPLHEAIVGFFLVSLSLVMLVVCGMVLWGLRWTPRD